MKLSRKRTKELRKLKSSAEDLWQQQQDVLDQASTVLRQASHQATLLTNEHVVPRVKTTYESHVRPTVDKSVLVSKAVASTAKKKVVGDVFPAVAGVAGSALGILEVTKDFREKLDELSRNAKKSVAAVPVKKSGPGAGTIVLIVLGIVALAGVAYAAWQTFRADDDLWIADDEPEVTGSTNPTGAPTPPAA
jgi:hypothetical protein